MDKSSDVSNSDFKILFIMSLGPEKNEEILFTCVVLVTYPTKLTSPPYLNGGYLAFFHTFYFVFLLIFFF